MAIFNLFGEKGKLGIDIGTAAIKIVELEKSGGRFVLKNYYIYYILSKYLIKICFYERFH